MLASTGQDGTVRLWDVKSRSQVGLWQGYDATIPCGCDRFVNYNLTFSPNTQWLLMFSGQEQDQGIWIWDGKLQNKPIYLDLFAQFKVTQSGAAGINHGFNTNSSMFATVHGDTVYLRDTATNNIRAVLNNPQDNLEMVFKFSPNSHWFGATPRRNMVVIWDTDTGKENFRFISSAKEITSFDFSPDGTMVALGTSDSTIEVWSLLTGKIITSIVHHSKVTNQSRAYYVQFTPDNSAVVVEWE